MAHETGFYSSEVGTMLEPFAFLPLTTGRSDTRARGDATPKRAMADDDDLYGGYTATTSFKVRREARVFCARSLPHPASSLLRDAAVRLSRFRMPTTTVDPSSDPPSPPHSPAPTTMTTSLTTAAPPSPPARRDRRSQAHRHLGPSPTLASSRLECLFPPPLRPRPPIPSPAPTPRPPTPPSPLAPTPRSNRLDPSTPRWPAPSPTVLVR